MTHTPLPWKRCSANEGKCSCGLIWSVPADCTVASAHSANKKEYDDGPTLEQSLLNADFIVRAVNCHDELVGACQIALTYLLEHTPKGNIRDSSHFNALNEHANGVCKPLRAAIAKAQA